MRNPKHSPTESMHPFLKITFGVYAVQLRKKYPGRRIRNAAVFASAIPAFERLGYIELVDARAGIRKGIPECLIDRIKRTKRQPIWIPSRNFPLGTLVLEEMHPYFWDDAILWRHTPSECLRIGQIEDTTLIQEKRNLVWRSIHKINGNS